MAQFVALQSGNLFSTYHIMELRADVKFNDYSEKCKVSANINILTENGTIRTLISGIGEAPWMDSEDEDVELYEIVRTEREAAEGETRKFFGEILRMIFSDQLLYYVPSYSMHEELQLIAEKAAKRIVYAAHYAEHKGETEDE